MNFFKKLWLKIKTEYKFRKKLREIKKPDPFIYK